MIKAVFFDWFNTLAHYYPPREELERQALQELGYNIPLIVVSQGLYLADKNFYEENARLPLRQRTREEQARIYLGFQRTILTEAGVQAADDLVIKLTARMRELNSQMKFVLYDDVPPALQAIRSRKLIIGLLSNLQLGIDDMCRELGISPFINFTVTSGEVGSDKPNPPIFLRALELARVNPNEAVHIGDQYRNDVLGARGVGIHAVLLDRNNLHIDITDCPRLQGLNEVEGWLDRVAVTGDYGT